MIYDSGAKILNNKHLLHDNKYQSGDNIFQVISQCLITLLFKNPLLFTTDVAIG